MEPPTGRGGSVREATQSPSVGSIPPDPTPVALIAGGSRGLGLLLAEAAHLRGLRPVIAARSAEELERAAEQLAEQGILVETAVMDVAQRSQVDDVVNDVEQRYGPVEVLLCVAGVIQVGPLAALDHADFVEAVDVMLWGPVHTVLAVLPGMRRRGRGRIGIITSVGGLISAPHLLPYSTAKFGAVGFARGLRAELAGSGVTVTMVAPGLMRTGSHLHAKFKGDVRREYAWFSAAASAPVLSMNARRAARRIMAAVLNGRAVVLLTPLARIAPRVDALVPWLSSAALALTSRLLPSWSFGVGSPAVQGRQVEERLTAAQRSWLHMITGLNRRAAERTNQ
jgi:NAD(P)-dependent dehydrogenase (short-subunit alcohol dehydrogenase family)